MEAIAWMIYLDVLVIGIVIYFAIQDRKVAKKTKHLKAE